MLSLFDSTVLDSTMSILVLQGEGKKADSVKDSEQALSYVICIRKHNKHPCPAGQGQESGIGKTV